MLQWVGAGVVPQLARFETVLVDLQRFDLRFERRGRHPELDGRTRRPRHPAAACRQSRLNPFSLIHHRRVGTRPAGRWWYSLPRQPARIDGERLALTHYYR